MYVCMVVHLLVSRIERCTDVQRHPGHHNEAQTTPLETNAALETSTGDSRYLLPHLAQVGTRHVRRYGALFNTWDGTP